MTTWSATLDVGESLPAHGLHYAMLLLGLWGLGALLLPHALDRYAGTSTAPHHPDPRDPHELRVAALRSALATGSLTAPAGPDAAPSAATEPATGPATEPATGTEPALGLPLALVASSAAASIHAAVVPPHLADGLLVGGFFVAAASAQLAWSAALLQRPTARLLVLGAWLNAAFVALWALTRTVGLPFGLLPERHPVGGWDVACVLWELAVVWCCGRTLRAGCPTRVPGWFDWHPTSRAAVGAIGTSLVLLTVLGAHS